VRAGEGRREGADEASPCVFYLLNHIHINAKHSVAKGSAESRVPSDAVLPGHCPSLRDDHVKVDEVECATARGTRVI